MLDKNVLRVAQSAAAGDNNRVQIRFGTSEEDADGLYRLEYRGRRMLWVSDQVTKLRKRMLVCATMQEAGHRGIVATFETLRAYCVWKPMEEDAPKNVCDCIVRTMRHAGWCSGR